VKFSAVVLTDILPASVSVVKINLKAFVNYFEAAFDMSYDRIVLKFGMGGNPLNAVVNL